MPITSKSEKETVRRSEGRRWCDRSEQWASLTAWRRTDRHAPRSSATPTHSDYSTPSSTDGPLLSWMPRPAAAAAPGYHGNLRLASDSVLVRSAI